MTWVPGQEPIRNGDKIALGNAQFEFRTNLSTSDIIMANSDMP